MGATAQTASARKENNRDFILLTPGGSFISLVGAGIYTGGDSYHNVDRLRGQCHAPKHTSSLFGEIVGISADERRLAVYLRTSAQNPHHLRCRPLDEKHEVKKMGQ